MTLNYKIDCIYVWVCDSARNILETIISLNPLCFSDPVSRDKTYSSSEEEEESAQEKKLRLAKQYLAQIEIEGRAKTNYSLNSHLSSIILQ